ncbi:MAG: UDP-N-acetylmuramate dehydrogenase [Elainellaceae cyanobacterium]
MPTSMRLPRLPLGTSPKAIALPGSACLIQPQMPLARLTSFRVGGNAELFAAPRSMDDVYAILEWADKQSVPLMTLGAGSNLLISDRGLPGLVICTRHLRHTTFDHELGQVVASAGDSLARLAWQTAEQGWRGMEWAVGIPGTVGGAVVMNAGAHLSCAADIFVEAHGVSDDGTIKVFRPEDLEFSYRTSSLQHSQVLITQARFQLKPGFEAQEIMSETRSHLKKRHATQPYHLPSCGSVFRNPSAHAAGWLIEQTGLKGHQIGGAQVAQRHANFILNLGDATANDIFNLIQDVQQQVEEKWSLLLRPEVKFIGEF